MYLKLPRLLRFCYHPARMITTACCTQVRRHQQLCLAHQRRALAWRRLAGCTETSSSLSPPMKCKSFWTAQPFFAPTSRCCLCTRVSYATCSWNGARQAAMRVTGRTNLCHTLCKKRDLHALASCLAHRIWTNQHFSPTQALTAALAELEEPSLPVGVVAFKALRLMMARQTHEGAQLRIRYAFSTQTVPDLDTVLLELLRYPAEREEFVTQLSAPVVENDHDDVAGWSGRAYLEHFVTRAKNLMEAGKHTLPEVLQAYLAYEQPQIAASASAPLIVLDAQGLAMWPLQSSP